jgi:hypothetical protein
MSLVTIVPASSLAESMKDLLGKTIAVQHPLYEETTIPQAG